MIFAKNVNQLMNNTSKTSPTILTAIPHVYKKTFNNVITNNMATSGLSDALFHITIKKFDTYVKAKENDKSYSSLQFTLAQKLVFPKIREKLSKQFDKHIQHFVSDNAPLAQKISYFFSLLGFDMLKDY